MTAGTRRQNLTSYLADPDYRAGRAEFVDLSGVEGSDFDFDRAQMLVHQLKEQGPPTDVATQRVLWAPGDVPYGCARMYQAVAEVMHNGHVEVFRNEGRALAALSLEHHGVADLLASEVFVPQPPTRTP